MLDISRISLKAVHHDDWKKFKVGKFSASTNGKLFSENSHKGVFSRGAITHIQNIAGEIHTGLPMRPEFSTGNTDYGNAHEAEAIDRAAEILGYPVLRGESDVLYQAGASKKNTETHKLIEVDEYQACTPDALLALKPIKYLFDSTGTKIKVAPLEVKCPPVHHRFIKLWNCRTPADLKEVDKIYYYQALTQLVYCQALTGYFAGYNFNFANDIRIITFNKLELADEVIKFNQTMHFAKQEVIKLVNQLKAA